MAEKLVLVCDICGVSPAQTVTFRIDGTNLQKDYCVQHLEELREGARRPRRGRRPGTKKSSSRKKSPAKRRAVGSRK